LVHNSVPDELNFVTTKFDEIKGGVPNVACEAVKIFPEGSISKLTNPFTIPLVCHKTVPAVVIFAKLVPYAPITILPSGANCIFNKVPPKSFPAASSITVHISLPSVSYFFTIIVPTSP